MNFKEGRSIFQYRSYNDRAVCNHLNITIILKKENKVRLSDVNDIQYKLVGISMYTLI